ncbi:MAG: hypothetical protein KGM97_06915 [Alphaproteobacteria bacterium]|nr:hypothetical protein [Alphaproteobacteria bacterium]
MAEKNSLDRGSADADAEFAARLMKELPSAPVSGTLQARILADFDAVAAKRKFPLWTRPLRALRDAVWPSAPVWKPASVFALSLAIGLAAGTLIPSSVLTDGGSVQPDTAAFDTDQGADLSGGFIG